MIKNKHEEHQVTQQTSNESAYICDVCGRKMKIPQHYWIIRISNVCPTSYTEEEDFDEYMCCSKNCVDKIYNKYFHRCQENLNNYDVFYAYHGCTIEEEN